LTAQSTRRPWGQVTRAAVGLLSMLCFFKAFALLPLGDAVALAMSGPIFLTALSVPLLGERVGIRRWSAVVVGFLGVVIMTRPGSGSLQLGAALAIGGAVFYALAMVSVRRLSATEGSTAIVFYMALFSTVATGIVLPFFWVDPDARGWMLLVAIGLLGGVAQMLMTQAFRFAPVATIAPFEYLALVYATGLGYLIWGDIPDVWIIGGAAVVVASGLYILHREAVLGRPRPPGPAAHP
jgi:drug/metabolite transporter (DMT)-like permease